jgi:hypothetical protein
MVRAAVAARSLTAVTAARECPRPASRSEITAATKNSRRTSWGELHSAGAGGPEDLREANREGGGSCVAVADVAAQDRVDAAADEGEGVGLSGSVVGFSARTRCRYCGSRSWVPA